MRSRQASERTIKRDPRRTGIAAGPDKAASIVHENGDLPHMKSLAKGLAVLDLLLAQPTVRTTDVAERLGLDKGTASRILQTLVHMGYAERAAVRQYAHGPKLRDRSAVQPGAGIKDRARPLLQKLAEKTGESAHLGILSGDQVLYLDRVDSAAPLRVDRPVGTLSPLHCTALGKVFLAFAKIPMPAELNASTVRTTTAPELLQAQMRQVVQQGYAIDDEEFCLGVRCVAAPLRDSDGTVVAAIGISGPTARVDLQRLRQLGDLVCDYSRNFSDM